MDDRTVQRLWPAVLAVVVLFLVGGTILTLGATYVNRGGWFAGVYYLINTVLSVVPMTLVIRNLTDPNNDYNWQERRLKHGLFALLLGSSVAYLIKAFDHPTITPGTALITIGLLLVTSATLGPRVRFLRKPRLDPLHLSLMEENALLRANLKEATGGRSR